MDNQTITGDAVVAALKALKRTVFAKDIAAAIGTDSVRAVATAARAPCNDGRIKLRWSRRTGLATYRYVRKQSRIRP